MITKPDRGTKYYFGDSNYLGKIRKPSVGGTDRRTFLSQLGLAAGAMALGFPGIAEADTGNLIYAPPTPPNILIIMVDQLRYKELGQLAAGTAFPGLATVLPNITALQAQSVEFTNFFVAATTCTPSRAAFMTGLYPPQTCMYITQGNGAAPSMNTGFPTFASYLSSISGLGYQTAFYGKWHLSNFSDDIAGSLSSYGFTITGNETPSPDGLANEGMTGGIFANPPHQTANGNWINDQQIVTNFAAGLGASLANPGTPVPWCAVVSLINPHDIANYPLYLLNYCTAAGPNAPIQPYYPPQTPGTAPTWAVTGTPNLPVQYELFTYSPQKKLPACLDGVTAFSDYTAIHLVPPNSKPTNTAELQGSPKPMLQQYWQDAVFTENGSVQEPVAGPPYSYDNGDWGQYLNVYYWLASCADQLIGNLATPDSHLVAPTDSSYTPCTILGQVAALLGSASPLNATQKLALSNTVIVFTADHGELGGAHSLPQKHACSYDEAINVPLFVSLPGQTTNIVRNQLVSSVDVFGLICGLAQPTYNAQNVPTWQAASPQLATRTDMIGCLKSNGYAPLNRTISIGGVATPYIFHAYNEWFRVTATQTPWKPDDPWHVLCLRTATQKLVYYDTWATGSPTAADQQAGYYATDYDTTNLTNYAAKWTTANAEYYALSSNPAETGNGFSNTTLLDIQTNFETCVNNELQLALPASLGSARTSAKTAFQNYITIPTVSAITNASGGPITANMGTQTVYVTGGNVGAGPTVYITFVSPNGPADNVTTGYPVDDDVIVSGAFPVAVSITVAGSYNVLIQNPSGLSSTPLAFTVS